jgi:hypothetical protein
MLFNLDDRYDPEIHDNLVYIFRRTRMEERLQAEGYTLDDVECIEFENNTMGIMLKTIMRNSTITGTITLV